MSGNVCSTFATFKGSNDELFIALQQAATSLLENNAPLLL
jgi:hypothetical protein